MLKKFINELTYTIDRNYKLLKEMSDSLPNETVREYFEKWILQLKQNNQRCFYELSREYAAQLVEPHPLSDKYKPDY
jgi:fructose-1-phosphate kinase PfkB-like protein